MVFQFLSTGQRISPPIKKLDSVATWKRRDLDPRKSQICTHIRSTSEYRLFTYINFDDQVQISFHEGLFSRIFHEKTTSDLHTGSSCDGDCPLQYPHPTFVRSEEHTSELQSRGQLV